MSSKTLKKIDMSLSTESIENAIKQIKQFQKDLVEMCSDLARKLVQDGIEIAKMQVVSMDAVFTGYLEQSIQGVYFAEEHCGVIFSDVPQAIFVEYGTGFEGASEKYPGEYPEGYEPDQTGHGKEGWWYPAPWGWYVPKGGDRLAWSKGMLPRPFMYNTLTWLAEIAATEGINMFHGST